MTDLQDRLLPPIPASAINPRGSAYIPSAMASKPYPGLNAFGFKKLGQGLRSWIRVSASGDSEVIEADKLTMMRHCDLPARDLRLLDPLLEYPSTILRRENAIVVNLELIRCIITADEVFILNSLDSFVLEYVVELQKRLSIAGAGDVWEPEGAELSKRRGRYQYTGNVYDNNSPDNLPFEFRALEVALESACTRLDSEAAELEIEVYPLLDKLISKISTLNLECVRRVKAWLVALTRRVQKMRDEIEQLLNDDSDMAEMYLTEKKSHMESSNLSMPLPGIRSSDIAPSVSASVSSPPNERRPERMRSSESIAELEMLLEAYFIVTDRTLNKLTTLKEYIDDTEDFINFQLDKVRNDLMQYENLLTTVAFVVAIFGVVMDFEMQMFQFPAFKGVLIITGIMGIVLFLSLFWFLKCKRRPGRLQL